MNVHINKALELVGYPHEIVFDDIRDITMFDRDFETMCCLGRTSLTENKWEGDIKMTGKAIHVELTFKNRPPLMVRFHEFISPSRSNCLVEFDTLNINIGK